MKLFENYSIFSHGTILFRVEEQINHFLEEETWGHNWVNSYFDIEEAV